MEEVRKLKSDISLLQESLLLKWKQRAKVHWLQHGDRNTRFFHLSASQRQKRNRIDYVEDEYGTPCTTAADIGNAFTQFYKALFTSSDPAQIECCLHSLSSTVSTEMNDMLLQAFIADDVQQAVFQMGPYKAP